MQFNPYGFQQMPQFGGGMNPDGSMSMAGGSGFGGDMPPLGGGMFGAPQQQQKKHGGGFAPWMMMSPLLGMFMSGHPNIGLGMLSPALGIAGALGAFGHHGSNSNG